MYTILESCLSAIFAIANIKSVPKMVKHKYINIYKNIIFTKHHILCTGFSVGRSADAQIPCETLSYQR